MNVTGRNFASTTFNKVENQIQDAYESLADEEDRKLYKEYMLTISNFILIDLKKSYNQPSQNQNHQIIINNIN